MLYDPSFIPTSIEELYTSGWANFMRLKISKYCLNDINNSIEDIFEDMILQMISNNYIENYDVSGRPFEVYLSIFIKNFMSKRYKKEYGSKNGQKILLAKSLEDKVSDTIDSTNTSCLSDLIEDKNAEFDDYFVLIESIKSDLAEFKASSSVEFNGEIYNRDPITVFELLQQGLSVAEIAEVFQTSKQFVYLLLKKIRNCDSLLEY